MQKRRLYRLAQGVNYREQKASLNSAVHRRTRCQVFFRQATDCSIRAPAIRHCKHQVPKGMARVAALLRKPRMERVWQDKLRQIEIRRSQFFAPRATIQTLRKSVARARPQVGSVRL